MVSFWFSRSICLIYLYEADRYHTGVWNGSRNPDEIFYGACNGTQLSGLGTRIALSLWQAPNLLLYPVLHTSVYLKYFVSRTVYWNSQFPWILFVELWQRSSKCTETFVERFVKRHIHFLWVFFNRKTGFDLSFLPPPLPPGACHEEFSLPLGLPINSPGTNFPISYPAFVGFKWTITSSHLYKV